jgi:hypothetical protein
MPRECQGISFSELDPFPEHDMEANHENIGSDSHSVSIRLLERG